MAATSTVSVLSPMVLARALPPAELGAYKQFFLYVSAGPWVAATSGLQDGLYYWNGLGDGGRLARQSWSLNLVWCLAVSGVLAAASPLLADAFAWPGYRVAMFAATAALYLVGCFNDEALVASGRVRGGGLFAAGFDVLRVLTCIAVAAYVGQVDAVLLAYLLVTALKAAIGTLYAHRAGIVSWSFDRADVRSLLRYAAPVSLAFFAALLFTNVDQFVLSHDLDPAKFAIYATGCLALPPLFAIQTGVVRTLVPKLTAALERGAIDRAAGMLRSAMDDVALLIIPATVGLVVFAEPIVVLLYSAAYRESAEILRIFAVTYAFLMILHNVVPRARGDSRWILRSGLVCAAVAVVLVPTGYAAAGAKGALVAALLVQAMLRSWGLVYLRRQGGMTLRSVFPTSGFLRYGLVSLTVALVCVGLRNSFESEIAWFLVCAPAFAVIYLSVFLPQRLVAQGQVTQGETA